MIPVVEPTLMLVQMKSNGREDLSLMKSKRLKVLTMDCVKQFGQKMFC